MQRQPAETIDTPTQAAQVRALTDEEIVGQALDRALQLPESLRLGFLLRELNGKTKGNA